MALETIRPAREPLPADTFIPSAQEIETSNDAFVRAMDTVYRHADIPYRRAVVAQIVNGDIDGLEKARRVYNQAAIIHAPLHERLDAIGKGDTHLARQARSLTRLLISHPDYGSSTFESPSNTNYLTQWRIIRSQLSYQNTHGTESLIQKLRANPDPQRRRAIYETLHNSDRELASIVRQSIARDRKKFKSIDEFIASYIHGQCEDLTKKNLQSLVADCTRQLLPLFAALDHELGQYFGKKSIDAWDSSYGFQLMIDRAGAGEMKFRSIQDATSLALKQLGHNDLYDKLTVIVPKERHDVARCVAINPPEDVAVIVHEPREDIVSFSDYFHEIGHGIHFAGMSSDIAYIDRRTGNTWKEAMAFLYEDLLLEPGVLMNENADVNTLACLRVLSMTKRIGSLREVLLHLSLQLTLYEGGAESLTQDDLAVKTQKIMRRFKPFYHNSHPFWWANDMYIVEYPFYGINYLYGWMIAAQIRAWWKRTHSEPIISKTFGDFLRTTCYPPGNSMPWQEQLKAITGEEVNPAYLIEELSIAKNLFGEVV